MFEGLLSPTHLIIILAIALVVFGPSRLPQLGRALGQSLRAFKSGFDEKPQQVPPPSGEERSE